MLLLSNKERSTNIHHHVCTCTCTILRYVYMHMYIVHKIGRLFLITKSYSVHKVMVLPTFVC